MKFEILDIDKNSEDTCSLQIIYDKEFENVVCKHYKKQKVTKLDVENYVYFVLEGLK